MTNVKEILVHLEQQFKVKVLFACETGSRAWGFPSPDSDYDIRFVYMHDRDWYLHLGERKDTIDIAITNDLDISGWDFRKSLKLLKKSNAPLIERFQSPIEYYQYGNFKEEFIELIKHYYSPTAVFYHHYSLAKKFWEDIKDADEFRLKSWFYLVRSLLSCNWILRDENVLPMHIKGLMKYVEQEDVTRIEHMIHLKSTVTEKYMHRRDEKLHEYILSLLDLIESGKDRLAINSSGFDHLNNYFIKTIDAAHNR